MYYEGFGCGPNTSGPITPMPIGPIVPPMYPYMGQNYYACDCCAHMHQPTPNTQHPTNGPLQLRAKAGGPGRDRALRLAELMEELRSMRKVNVSPGHCMGLVLSAMEE